MSEIRKRNITCTNLNDEPPEKKLISDADIFVKKLSESQLNTKITLQSELAREKLFTKAINLEPLGDYISGASSLSSFQKTANHVEQVELFKAAGLLESDIELYFDSLNGNNEFLAKKYKNLEGAVMKQRLCDINTMVKNYEEKLSNSIKQVAKPCLPDFGLTVKPDSVETKLMKFALENQKHNSLVLPHPMDHLEEIEKCRFSGTSVESADVTKIRRKARKLFNRINTLERTETLTNNFKVKPLEVAASLNTKWDVREKSEEKPKLVEKKVYTCKVQNRYTIKNGEIIKINKEKSFQEEAHSKLSLEDIKLISKFKNYKIGTPSKILYLKNLSNNTKEEDLNHVFQKYKDDVVSYRILSGKMRGQAFVTFNDIETATRALYDVNGSFLKNKPVIIEYGKGI